MRKPYEAFLFSNEDFTNIQTRLRESVKPLSNSHLRHTTNNKIYLSTKISIYLLTLDFSFVFNKVNITTGESDACIIQKTKGTIKARISH